MGLTAVEKRQLAEKIQEVISDDVLEKEDAVAILDVLIKASERKKQELIKRSPWIQSSDIVQ